MRVLHPVPGSIVTTPPDRRPLGTRLVISAFLLAATVTAATMGFGGDELPVVWFAYAGYFALRWIEHHAPRTQFWLSNLAFVLAVSVVALDAWLSSAWGRLAVVVWVLMLAWLVGMGRRVHASTLVLSFYPPVHLLSFFPRTSPILLGIALVLSTVFVMVAAFRNRLEREIAANHGGRAYLDTGAISVGRPKGDFWLPPRVELAGYDRKGPPYAHCHGPSSHSGEGELLIRRADCERCREHQPADAMEHRLTVNGVELVVAYRHLGQLVAALESGVLAPALGRLASVDHPLVIVKDGTIWVGAMPERRAEEPRDRLLGFALALHDFAPLHTDGAYR